MHRRAKIIQIALIVLLNVLTVQRVFALDDDDRMLVINGLAETLDLVDRTAGSVISNVLTLGLAPNEMDLAPSAVLLTNSISDELWVIDRNSYSVLRTAKFPDGDNPYDVETIDDSLCAVSLTLMNQIMFVNYATGDTLQRVAVGISPQGLLRYGDRLWVANTGLDYNTFLYGQGTVDVIDVTNGSSLATINVGSNPQVIIPAFDGTMHVLCTGNYFDVFGIVYVISRQSLTVIDSIPLGGSPGDLIIDRASIAYVAAGGWVDSGYVYRYDAATRAVLNDESNPWTSARGVIGVMPRLEGGVWAYCFAADSVVGHGLDGQIEEAYQMGDGPQPGVHISNRIPGDLNDDGFVDALDLNAMIDFLFFAGSGPTHPNAADLDHSCFADSVDLNKLIDLLFFGGHGYWGCRE